MGGACGTDEERTDAYRVLIGKLKEREHLEDQDQCTAIIVKWIPND